MADARVETLTYKIIHADDVDYDSAPPLKHETQSFRMTAASDIVTFEMTEDFSNIQQAREVVQPFVDAWEVASGLRWGRNQFSLKFTGGNLRDYPLPGRGAAIHGVAILGSGNAKIEASMHVSRVSFPAPPLGFEVSEWVEAMHHRYMKYIEGATELLSTAYFIEDVIEKNIFSSTKSAATGLNVSRKVLVRIRVLASRHGGLKEGRKANADGQFSGGDRAWLEDALKALIWRSARAASGIDVSGLRKIRADDLGWPPDDQDGG